MEPSEPSLERSIRAHFAPRLRETGFKGSGRTYRRIRDDLIEIVDVQGSRYGGMFAINLAIHPCGVQSLSEGATEKSIKEYECAFRRRLSADRGDHWWGTGATQESMDQAVQEAALVYQEHGAPLFDRIGGPNTLLLNITADSLASGDYDFAGFNLAPTLTALILMRWRLHQGRITEAKELALSALKDARDDFYWRPEFEAALAI